MQLKGIKDIKLARFACIKYTKKGRSRPKVAKLFEILHNIKIKYRRVLKNVPNKAYTGCRNPRSFQRTDGRMDVSNYRVN